MDISNYDVRGKAEAGVFMPLCEPFKGGKPLKKGKDAPGFIVRGIASPTAQQRLAQLSDVSGKDETEADEAAMERLHNAQIDLAMNYIISAQNIELGDRSISTPDEIREVLNMTFPEMAVVKDDDGRPVMDSVKDKDGNMVEIPRFEATNWTFAQQVIDGAEKTSTFLDSK